MEIASGFGKFANEPVNDPSSRPNGCYLKKAEPPWINFNPELNSSKVVIPFGPDYAGVCKARGKNSLS